MTILPQSEHIWDVFEGFTSSTRLPAYSALYDVVVISLFHATSEIWFERQWFLIMPLMFRSSKTIRSYVFTRSELTFWVKSFLLLVILSWTRWTTFKTFVLSGVPLSVLDNFICAFARVFSSWTKNLGFSTCSPFESVMKLFRPTSTPIDNPVFGRDLSGQTSTKKDTNHFPVGIHLIVSLRISPTTALWSLILMSPILESQSLPDFKENPDWV